MDERKTSIDFVIKAAKDNPGVGRYDTYAYDEKIIKPPKGGISDKTDKYNFLDEVAFLSKQSPKQYDAIDMNKIRRKTHIFKIRAETEKEKL